MAFYIDDFGCLSGVLQQYADCQGLIPEAGEDWQDFQWSRHNLKIFTDPETGEAAWIEFRQKAIAATKRVFQDLDEFAASPEWYMGKPH